MMFWSRLRRSVPILAVCLQLASPGAAQVTDLVSRTFEADFVASPSDQVLHKEVVVGAALHDVWTSWTTVEGLRGFLGRPARVELRIGGPYEIYWVPDAPEGSRGGEGLRVLSYLPERMISFEWTAPPRFASIRGQRTWMVITMTPLSSDASHPRTRVSLDHLGWGRSGEWPASYAYFDEADQFVLDQLVRRYPVR